MTNNTENTYRVPASVAKELKTIANSAGTSAQAARWEFLAAMHSEVLATDLSFNLLANEYLTALTMGRVKVSDAGWGVIGAKSTIKAYIGCARFFTEAEAVRLAKSVAKHGMAPTTIYSKYNRIVNKATTDETRAAFVAALVKGDTEAAAKLVPPPKVTEAPTAADDDSEAGDAQETTEPTTEETTEETTEAPGAPLVESVSAPSLTERAQAIVDRMTAAEIESLISYATEALSIKEASEAEAASV